MRSHLRPVLCGFWLATVTCGSLSVGLTAPPDETSIASIVSNLRDRVAQTNGIELNWTEQEAPIAGQERPSTIHYRLCSAEKLLAFEFKEADEPTPKGDRTAGEYLGVFDGQATWELHPRPSTIGHPCGYVNRTENCLDRNLHVYSAKLALGVGFAEILERPNVRLLDQREEIDGLQCVVVSVPLGTDSSMFWLAEHRDFRVVKGENRSLDGRLVSRLKFEYERIATEDLLARRWQVKNWELQIPDGNKIVTATVESIQINQKFTPNTFHLDFSPGTVVCDLLAPGLVVDSVVAEDGTWAPIR